jgi:predicted CoA-substrate-specific enzyme activase
MGANYWFPEKALIIDIGGQDSKAIVVDGKGKVINFVMNDKCAAGTGRFLQVITHTLELELDQLDELNLSESAIINSMCTVFAESEVVSLLASGVSKEKIVAGLYHSIARRINGMVASFSSCSKVIFTGGLANSKGMQTILAKF